MAGVPTEGSDASETRRSMPGGVIVVPFVVGVAVTLLVVAATKQPITGGWVLTGVLFGVMLATLSLFMSYTRGQAGRAQLHAGRVASQGQETEHLKQRVSEDPLAAIQAVEQQSRKYLHTCVNCGGRVTVKADECPNCGQRQVFHCKSCNTRIRLTWENCPECGRSIP